MKKFLDEDYWGLPQCKEEDDDDDDSCTETESDLEDALGL